MSVMRLLLAVSLPLYVLDQVTKWLIVLNFERGEVRPQIEGFFNLVRVHNQGVAFGFGNGTLWAPIVFLCISSVALVGLVDWLRDNQYILLDTQWMTDHLRQFGGEEISREDYLKRLEEALEDVREDPSEP